MNATLKKANNEGFTLIELLIVIVVLGILAAVVVFSLGSVTQKSAVSACQSDGATINLALQAYNANNGAYPAAGSVGISALESTANGGPYLQQWPNNTAHYNFSLGASGALSQGIGATAAGSAWTGAATCTGNVS